MKRTVLVTGGGTGIGRAVASKFVAKNATVVIVGRREKVLTATAKDLSSQGQGKVVPRQCDVRNPTHVAGLAAWLAEDVTDTLDVLVNNAGGTGSLAPGANVAEAADYAWSMLSANLVGAYLIVHALAPHLRKPGGRIINISSIAAFRGGGDMYSAAKAGLVGLSYSELKTSVQLGSPSTSSRPASCWASSFSATE
jgi:3-oxoacyl-[acyl-carrier protein] reductase